MAHSETGADGFSPLLPYNGRHWYVRKVLKQLIASVEPFDRLAQLQLHELVPIQQVVTVVSNLS